MIYCWLKLKLYCCKDACKRLQSCTEKVVLGNHHADLHMKHADWATLESFRYWSFYKNGSPVRLTLNVSCCCTCMLVSLSVINDVIHFPWLFKIFLDGCTVPSERSVSWVTAMIAWNLEEASFPLDKNYILLVKSISTVWMIYRISMVRILINAKSKRHLLLLTLTVQIWKVKSVSIWSRSSRSVIQLRDTSWTACGWCGAQCGKQQPLIPSLTFLCAALLVQKASLIKSERSATTVAIRRVFVYTLCLRSHPSRHAVVWLWGMFSH